MVSDKSKLLSSSLRQVNTPEVWDHLCLSEFPSVGLPGYVYPAIAQELLRFLTGVKNKGDNVE